MDELLEKCFITLGLLVISRLGTFIPLPGIDYESFYCASRYNSRLHNAITFPGHGLAFIGLFALGIIPYVNASIFIQLITNVVPFLRDLQKEEGESGRRKIARITRFIALILAIAQSLGLSLWIRPYAINPSHTFVLGTTLSLSTGFMLNLWISEQITEKGIGKGPSLSIFVSLISHFPELIREEVIPYIKSSSILKNMVLGILFFIMMIGVIILYESTRQILLISSKQLLRKEKDDKANYISFKLNQVGVTPIMLASTSLNLAASLTKSTKNVFLYPLINFLSLPRKNRLIYLIVYFLLVMNISYFYGLMIIKPSEISKNLQQMESSIQGVRPGNNTASFLKKQVQRLSLLGAIFLSFIAIIPLVVEIVLGTRMFKDFGPAPLLILASIILQTYDQIQVHFHSKNYSQLMN